MVGLKNHSSEKRAKMSLIELAKLLMLEEKKEMKFSETFARVAELKGLNEDEKKAKIGQFYTDLNVDGSFVTTGENNWGLKRWQREEKKTEEILPATRRIKRRRKLDEEDEDTVDEFAMIDVNIDEMIDQYEEDEDEDDLDIDLDEEYDDYDD